MSARMGARWRVADPAAETHHIKRKKRGEPLTLAYFLERSKIDVSTGCWNWLGARNLGGYGAMRHEGKCTRPHRAVFQLVHGVILPSTIDVCHECNNRLCCNPDHLFQGSRAENMADCIKKGRFCCVPVLSGDASPNSKLTSDQVREIRCDSRSNRALAKVYGVDKNTIGNIRLKKTWRSL